ncbi:PIN domain-containing protein [Bradyrhizobium sp. HKCCYLR20261]|uniref:PIN domain-containing protein n=1 Tax=Bradyrhizobium sp. HKCCYLR20261 TaxID=3420760 RepID=UPI003EBD09DA
MICLDANIVIGMISGRNPTLRHRLGEQMRSGTPIGLSVVALFELRYVIAKSTRSVENERLLQRFLELGIDVLSFEAEDADHAGDIRAGLERAGVPIGPFDCLIAAQARRRNAALITQNTREFERVPGLLVVNWAA